MANRTCTFLTCERPLRARGLCVGHWEQQHKGRPLTPIPDRPKQSATAEDRFVFYVTLDEDCWTWGAVLDEGGYGVFWDARQHRAHRWSYCHFVESIPDELVIDHLCRNRACVNPDHLEPVAQRVNLERSPITEYTLNLAKTECPRGHGPYDKVHVSTNGRLKRACSACRREDQRRCRAKKRAQP